MHAAAARTRAQRARPQGWARQPWRLRYWLRASRLARLARACALLPMLLGLLATLGWLATKSVAFALLGLLTIPLVWGLVPLVLGLVMLCCWRLTCRAGGKSLRLSLGLLLASGPVSRLLLWVSISAD